MDITIKTPMVVDKAVAFFKTAFAVISRGAHVALNFVKVHAPLITLIAGTVLTITGFVLAWIFRKKEGKQEAVTEQMKEFEEPETKKQKAIRIVKKVAPIAAFIIGTGLQITSFIISAGRINSLSKALAAALNAGSVLGTAKIASEEELPPEKKEAIEAARNQFSFQVVDTRAYTPKDPYFSLLQLRKQLDFMKTRLTNFGSITWNDLLCQFGLESTPAGYTIGWTSPEEYGYVLVDPYNKEITDHDMTLAACTGDLQGYRIFFTGMHSLVDTAYKVEGEA